MAVDLTVNVCGIEFKNPIVIASATPTKDAKYMKKAVDSGAGAIIAKSISSEEMMRKYVRPRFTILYKKGWPYCFSNYSCEFLATYTPEDWVNELKEVKKYCERNNTILIGSVAGKDVDDWIKLSKMVMEAGVDMIELNFGCPHPKGLKMGFELGRDAKICAEIVKSVKSIVNIPIFAKLTPEGVDVVEVAKELEKAGVDGITAINRYPALDIDIESCRPLLHSTFAGVGGPWMLPITLKWIAKLAMEIKIPISATNGIWTWQDIVKCIMCGASTVQTCTAIMYGRFGYGIVKNFIDGLKEFMERKGFNKINEFKGIILNQILPFDKIDRDTKLWSVVNEEKCNGCRLCLNWCFYDAITMRTIGKKEIASIDKMKCDGCGLCVSLCPMNAITMEGARVYL
ncbi:MAG: tRNA-dihydrouridine synthase [Nitrososphaerales archaeon]